MTGRGCMKIRQWVLALTLLLTIGSLNAIADPIAGVGDVITGVHTIRLVVAPSDASILIIGHLTRNGNAIEGTSFFLHWNPLDEAGSKTSQDFHSLVRGRLVNVVPANGVQIAYILGPNALVSFTISSDQFVVHDFLPDSSEQFVEHDSLLNTKILDDWLESATETSIRYIFPHLPEDPTGQAAIAFF